MHHLNTTFTALSLHQLGQKLEERGYIEDCPSEFRHHFRKVAKKGIRFIDFNYQSQTVTAYTIPLK